MQFLFLFSLNALLSFFQTDYQAPPIQQAMIQQKVNPPLCIGVLISVKVFLQGPYDAVTTHLMKDNLRTNGPATINGIANPNYAVNGTASLIPKDNPYSTSTAGVAGVPGFTHSGIETIASTATVFGVTGNNAIVDWVLLELRDPTTPATIVATRAALLQVDGDVVDVDGTSPVNFSSTNCGSYYVVVRHRNHLGIRTNVTIPLDNATPTVVDFTLATIVTFGTGARKTLDDGALAMYAGNVIHQNSTLNTLRQIIYAGIDNDGGPILSRIGGASISLTVKGYYSEDTNMDSIVKYAGLNNDRGIILVNVGSISISTKLTEQL